MEIIKLTLEEKINQLKKNPELINREYIFECFKNYNIEIIELGIIIENSLSILFYNNYIFISFKSEFIFLYESEEKYIYECKKEKNYINETTKISFKLKEQKYELLDIMNYINFTRKIYTSTKIAENLNLYHNKIDSFIMDGNKIIDKIKSEGKQENIKIRGKDSFINEVFYNSNKDFNLNRSSYLYEILLKLAEIKIFNLNINKKKDLIKIKNEIIKNVDLIKLYSDENTILIIKEIEKNINLIDNMKETAKKIKDIKLKIKNEEKNSKNSSILINNVVEMASMIPYIKIDLNLDDNNLYKNILVIKTKSKIIKINEIKEAELINIIESIKNFNSLIINNLSKNITF